MGLGSVELLLEIEEEFGVAIPDRDAEKMRTVGDVYEWLKRCIAGIDPSMCLTQSVFYKLRRALVENYRLERHAIIPETRLTDFLSVRDIEDGWPFLQMFIEVHPPPFAIANKIVGFRLSKEPLTIRQLVDALIVVNGKLLNSGRDSDDEIWQRLVQVFCRQLNVEADDIKPEASMSKDLGVD
ncbi:MAG: phosphopantetheine-binding protein [Candidatus Obscuribacterales bacterium]|nr:phosphopantetheine-binding protein [Candidatus Obscuribacterales bacterium]